LQAENETKDDQIRLLTEDNERWKNRNQQILQKYERIDPVELQNLKDQLEAANSEQEKLKVQLADAERKNRAVAEAWKIRHDKAVSSAKARMDQNKEVIENLQATIAASSKEAADGSSQIETVRAQAETAKEELRQQIAALQGQLDELRRNPPATDGSIWETEKQTLEESIKQKDAEITRISTLARGAERAKVFLSYAMLINRGKRPHD
jgi:nucleoprotein TPR